MLVLSRQKDETVIIGGSHTLAGLLTPQQYDALVNAAANDDELGAALCRVIGLVDEPIRVTCVDIRGDKVRLGFEAHKKLDVDREEVERSKRWQREEADRMAAAEHGAAAAKA